MNATAEKVRQAFQALPTASAREIADAAEVNIASVYRYLPDNNWLEQKRFHGTITVAKRLKVAQGKTYPIGVIPTTALRAAGLFDCPLLSFTVKEGVITIRKALP